MRRIFGIIIAAASLISAAAGSGIQTPVTDATLRHRDSIADLGRRLYFGDSLLPPEPVRAMLLIAEASHLGDPRADNNLAFILINGDTAFRDPERAASLFARAAAAGLPTAMAQLADLRARGIGAQADTASANELYLRAAEKGLQDAEYKYIALNRPRWLALSPDSLLAIAHAIYPLRAPSAAVEILSLATAGADSIPPNPDADPVPPQATALAILADAAARGLGSPYDFTKSLSLFLSAAALGDPSAQFIIAETLDMTPDALIPLGTDPASHYNDPRFWYQHAARMGITDAAKAYQRLLPAVRQR